MLEKLLANLAARSANMVQSRTGANTVNFFTRRTSDHLWRTVSHVSPAGVKRGRARTRQKQKPLNVFYRVGFLKSSPLRILYPGLNVPIDPVEKSTAHQFKEPMYLQEPTEEEKQGSLHYVRDALAKRTVRKKKHLGKERLPAMMRGFSGGTYLGQRMGAPPDVEGNSMADFDCVCFFIDRITSMHPRKGRIYSFRAFVFIGNGNRIGGYGLGKSVGLRINKAIEIAIRKASRSLFHIELHEDRTIYQDFFAECRNTRVFAQRQVEGFGLRCHPRIMKICELLGIKDLHVYVEGNTTNYIALTYAFVTGLVHQETHQHLADRTRLHVVELSPNRHYYPKIIASPLNSPVKDDSEVEPKERMKYDDYYGEGRFPLKKNIQKPYYFRNPGHQLSEWRKHPYRNMEQKIIRLLADGVVKRWTRKERYQWSQKEFEDVMSGRKPMPLGIGLTHVNPPQQKDGI